MTDGRALLFGSSEHPAKCDCGIPALEGAGQHALNCGVFANDRSTCCDAPIRHQPDHGDGTVLVICTRCEYQCRVRP